MNDKAIQGTSIGYAINLMMDYGSGRQITISGTLPLGAALEEAVGSTLRRLGLAMRFHRVGSMFCLFFTDGAVLNLAWGIAGLNLLPPWLFGTQMVVMFANAFVMSNSAALRLFTLKPTFSPLIQRKNAESTPSNVRKIRRPFLASRHRWPGWATLP